MKMKTITGIPASYGIAIGPVFLYVQAVLDYERCEADDPEEEWARFETAQEAAKQQLDQVYQKALAETGEEQAEIFSAHTLMVEDPELVGGIRSLVFDDGLNIEAAVSDTVENFAAMLEAIDDEYLSARALDIRDVGTRLLRNLLGVTDSPTKNLTRPSWNLGT